MPKLVSRNSVSDDKSVLLSEEDATAQLSDLTTEHFLPLSVFLTFIEENGDASNCSVWLSADDNASLLEPHVNKLSAVALNFENFMDGRSFSQARILREDFDFKGEIRACGSFIRDQIFYLARCGVEKFSVPSESDVQALQSSFNDFTESYQAACDEAQPLFRRRV